MKKNFLEDFGRFPVPNNVIPGLRKYLLKAGITKEPYTFFGALFLFSISVATLIYFLFFYKMLQLLQYKFDKTAYILIQGFGTIIIWASLTLIIIGIIIITIYGYLDIKIFNRTRKLEEILPDFLETVSSNLKGGMSFEKSLWMAMKPKFGILSHEIALAAKKVMTGHDVDLALTEFSLKYDSPMLRRSMSLIISQMQSGGEIADIIDRIVLDLKKTRALKEEMSASVLTYMIFIAVVVIIISPVLFGLAWALLDVISKITALLAQSMSGSSANLPFKISGESINPGDFIFPFSFFAILITAVGSSMIVSIIEKGNIKGGVKYIPMFALSSLGVYYIALKVMKILAGLIKF